MHTLSDCDGAPVLVPFPTAEPEPPSVELVIPWAVIDEAWRRGECLVVKVPRGTDCAGVRLKARPDSGAGVATLFG